MDEGRNRGPACRRHEQSVAGRRLDGRRSGHPVQRLVEASRVDDVESWRRQRVLGPLGEHVAKPGEEGRPSGARAKDRADRPRRAPAADECVEQPLSVRVPAEQLAYEDGRKLSRVRPAHGGAGAVAAPATTAPAGERDRRSPGARRRAAPACPSRPAAAAASRAPESAHDQVAPGGHPPYGVGVGALRDHQHAWPSHGHVRVVDQLYGPSTTTAVAGEAALAEPDAFVAVTMTPRKCRRLRVPRGRSPLWRRRSPGTRHRRRSAPTGTRLRWAPCRSRYRDRRVSVCPTWAVPADARRGRGDRPETADDGGLRRVGGDLAGSVPRSDRGLQRRSDVVRRERVVGPARDRSARSTAAAMPLVRVGDRAAAAPRAVGDVQRLTLLQVARDLGRARVDERDGGDGGGLGRDGRPPRGQARRGHDDAHGEAGVSGRDRVRPRGGVRGSRCRRRSRSAATGRCT